MRQKIIATGAGLVLVGLATVGAFAAQHATTALDTVTTPTGTVTDTATVTDTTTPDVTQTGTTTDTDTPTPGSATDTATPSDTDTPTPGASETATSEATSTEESGGGRAIKGIPEDNPGQGHHDGLCIKTTPSGNQVRVPCHAHGAATASATPTP